MFCVQIVSLIFWSGLALLLTIPLVRAFTTKAKSLDMLWASTWPMVLNRCAFSITSTFLDRAYWPLFFCYSLSLIAGIIFAGAIFHYGKGDI